MSIPLYKESKPDQTIQEIIEDLDLRFTSGNDIPIDRITISKKQWEVIKKRLKELEGSLTFHKERISYYQERDAGESL